MLFCKELVGSSNCVVYGVSW